MYQNPNFNKDRYREMRQQGPGAQRAIRLAKRGMGINPQNAAEVDLRITKKAFLKNSKRYRKLQAELDNIQLEDE